LRIQNNINQAKMKNLLQSGTIQRIFRFLKPWLSALIILVILRYTGMLSAVTDFAGSTIMKTGAMDYEPEDVLKKEDFDYNFTIKDLQGNVVDFNSFKGKVVFLNLWATWCGPCRSEMPSIEGLYNSIADKDKIVFVMLSMDKPEHQGKVVKYIQNNGFTFPVYTLDNNLSPQLREVLSIPTTFIISRDGKIASKKVGAANYDNNRFRKFLEGLMVEPETAQ
jgi:thiol-disulfide isomerase/thioredoxin